MDWDRDLPSWPHHDVSKRIRVSPHDWHVQIMGNGPDLVLLHGAGGSTHSWRDVMPILAKRFRVIAVDLPGHGFTRLGALHRSGLLAMSADLEKLFTERGWKPHAIVGHSAGAAIALSLADRGLVSTVVGINPALAPFRGLASVMFPMAARVLAFTPFMIDSFVRHLATPGRVQALLASTGSDLTPEGQNYYTRLFQDRAHLDGTLMMMAHWQLDPLLRKLPQIGSKVLFLCGGKDKAVPPDTALDAATRMPNARVEVIEDYGHLLHEEAPVQAARWIEDWCLENHAIADA